MSNDNSKIVNLTGLESLAKKSVNQDDLNIEAEEIHFEMSDFALPEITEPQSIPEIKPIKAIQASETLTGVQLGAKKMLIKFLKESEEDIPWIFHLNGTEFFAKSFVHRMRNELSRYRKVLIQRNKVPKRFKVIIQRIIEHPADKTVEVHLLRTYNARQVDDDLMDIMESFCVESKE